MTLLLFAKAWGVKVVQHEYVGQIEQKNYALSLTKHEIILALDGDEELSDELIESINELKSSGFDQSGFLMKPTDKLRRQMGENMVAGTQTGSLGYGRRVVPYGVDKIRMI